MKKYLVSAVFVILALILVTGCPAQPKGNEISGKNKDGTKITLNEMADIQPGTGRQMMEIGQRWWDLYYAGIDGNWDLAAYEIKETEEAMEIVFVTRPKRKVDLEAFLDAHKGPLSDAIKAKDLNKFKTAFDNSVKACNSCHAKAEMKFIKWQLPTQRPTYLSTKP